MDNNNFDIRNSETTLKGTSLMGPMSGPPSQVDSKDGRIVRIRPYYYSKDHDMDKLNPWVIDARGQQFRPADHTLISPYGISYKKRVYSENRVKWPLKRVDWDPDGDRNPQNRGKSKYVRISWDEATDIIASELLRIREKYGMSAVFSQADMHGEGKHVAPCHGTFNRLLSLLGPYTIQMRNSDSWEGWTWGSKHVWGCEPVGEMQPSGNCMSDIAKHSQLLLFWSCDPETTPLGFAGMQSSRLCFWFSELGIKSVYVDPALNYGAAVHADKWIPVKPNTDSALYLAIAYVWLTEGTYDKEYVRTHVVGEQPFFDYVLGREDGEPKSPAWAAEKCGVAEWTIKALARDWAKKITSVIIGNGGPGIRGPYSSEPARLQSILLGMQGLGKPGRHQAKMLEWDIHTDTFSMPSQGIKNFHLGERCELVRPPVRQNEKPQSVKTDALGVPDHDTRQWTGETPAQSIPKNLVHDAIENGHAEWWGLQSFLEPTNEQWYMNRYPAPGCSRIHMIWTDSPCMVTCWNDGFSFANALRNEEIEFVLAQHPWMENDCYLADIILPVATKHELEDICDDTSSGGFSAVYHEMPSSAPVGESVSDFEAAARVARKLGKEISDEFTYGEMPDSQVVEQFWRECGVADIDRNDDFHKKGIFVVPCDPEQQQRPAGLARFAEDPEGNPLTTPTGKLEFTSTALLEHFPDDPERPPYPKWITVGKSHDESLYSARAGKYPLLCMSNHGRWRMHANLDDITWNREIETMKIRARDGYQYEPAWMNPETAKERGIQFGDIVKVFNERGTVLCGAYVTQRLVPGVVYVDHGSRFDPISIDDRIDRGGAINLISPHNRISEHATGMVVSGYLVQVEKVTDEEMEAWKTKYPDAFERKTDKACGACLEGWLET